MKSILLQFVFLFVCATAHATAQAPDYIYIDGEYWELLGRPIKHDSTLYDKVRNTLPLKDVESSANWDGFVAYWSIQRNTLCLDSIRYEIYDKKTNKWMSKETMKRIFKRYIIEQQIVATWLTTDIRIAQGETTRYEHIGFNRNYETERIISIDHGKVYMKEAYLDGFSFEQADKPEISETVSKMFPLNLQEYPELINADSIRFHIQRAQVDSLGNLTKCNLNATIFYGNRKVTSERVAQEMAEQMKAYRPWRVYQINGKFVAKDIEHRSFLYILKK